MVEGTIFFILSEFLCVCVQGHWQCLLPAHHSCKWEKHEKSFSHSWVQMSIWCILRSQQTVMPMFASLNENLPLHEAVRWQENQLSKALPTAQWTHWCWTSESLKLQIFLSHDHSVVHSKMAWKLGHCCFLASTWLCETFPPQASAMQASGTTVQTTCNNFPQMSIDVFLSQSPLWCPTS